MRAALGALTPDRWLIGGWLITLGFRALGWLVRDAWARPEATFRAGFKGVLWDLVLVYALFALARAGWALGSLARNGALRALVRGGLLLPILTVGALSPLVRMLDVGHCYLGGSHWGLEGFALLHGDFAGRLLEPGAMGLLLGGGLLAAFMALALLRHAAVGHAAARGHAEGLGWRAGRLVALGLLPALVAAAPAAWALRDGLAFPAHVYDLRLLPETNFAAKALAWRQYTPHTLGPTPALEADLARRFTELGLLPSPPPALAGWPLVQSGLNEPALPFPRRATAAADARPNVVVTFVESLNRLFVHGLSGKYRGLMPELSALAGKMTSIEGFHNTASPTVTALVVALCGVHPPSHPRDLAQGQSVDGATAYSCLADLLGAQGYRTVYVQAASKKVAGKEFFLRTHGFEEVHGREDLRERWPGGEEGPWGAHDDVLVRYTQEQIARLEALRRRDGRPFLLVMLTLDTHDPGMAAERCALPKGEAGAAQVQGLPTAAGPRRLAAAYHCADAALGTLGRFLLAPGRRDQTLWALTADHAQFRTLHSAPLFTGPDEGWTFGPVPLLLHDPRHALPRRVEVLSGTEDLTPTLLHLLGVSPRLHSLGGHSVFGSRRRHPALVGRVGARLAYLQGPGSRSEVPIGMLGRLCASGKPVDAGAPGPLSACELAAWIRWQDALWAAQRLFPAERYQGAAGVDRQWLKGQMERDAPEELTVAPPRAATTEVGHE